MQTLVNPTVLLALVSALASPPAQLPTPDPAKAAGHWTGQGRLYDKKLAERVGPLAFDLVIDKASKVTGTVGGATLEPCTLEKVKNQLHCKAKLAGAVHADKDLRKDHLILLITAVDGDHLSADFHLKSRFGFDFSMRPGALEATRSKP